MAKSNPKLIHVLRTTAWRLANGANYEWGHMGRCNCGHLLQTITHMSDSEIARYVNFQLDEWTEYARAVCAGSGHPVEDLFLPMQEIGFYYDDVIHLENLSDKAVLSRLPEGLYLRKNDPRHVSRYLSALADMLAEEL